MDTLDRIEDLIHQRGWSRSEFCRRMDLPNNTLAVWRRGLNRSWEKHLEKIARVLGTTPAYLRGETGDPEPELLLLARQMEDLSEPEYRYVVKMLRQTADQVMAQLRVEKDARLPEDD